MVKVISLSEEAYKRLKNLKNGKSFSDVILTLTGKEKDIMTAFGILKDENAISSLERSYKDRYKLRLRKVKF